MLHTPQRFEIALRTRLPNYTSMFSAELFAIFSSLQVIQERKLNSPVIVSDSKSALTSLNPRNPSQHPIVSKIFHILRLLNQTEAPKFLWIPSHKQIPGNKAADIEAKKATRHNNYYKINPTKEEYFKMIRDHISAKRQIEWNHINTQLQALHLKLEYWDTVNQNSRKQEKFLLDSELDTPSLPTNISLTNNPSQNVVVPPPSPLLLSIFS